MKEFRIHFCLRIGLQFNFCLRVRMHLGFLLGLGIQLASSRNQCGPKYTIKNNVLSQGILTIGSNVQTKSLLSAMCKNCLNQKSTYTLN